MIIITSELYIFFSVDSKTFSSKKRLCNIGPFQSWYLYCFYIFYQYSNKVDFDLYLRFSTLYRLCASQYSKEEYLNIIFIM